jgi:hypothetical protein
MAACEQDEYSDLERAGLVLTFLFCYELGWNVFGNLRYWHRIAW